MAHGIDYWNSVAAGGTPVAANCPAPMQIVMPTGNDCQTPIRIGPTVPSTRITPRLDLQRCGKFTFDIDNSSTASVETRFHLGAQCFADFDSCDSETDPPDMDESTTLLIGSPNYNGSETNGGAADAVNCYLNLKTITVSQLTIKADATNQALIDGNSVTLKQFSPGGNFSSCDATVDANVCGPCYNASGVQPTQYNLGDLPLGATSRLEIDIPPGFVGTFEFCITGIEENVDITPCGNIPVQRCHY